MPLFAMSCANGHRHEKLCSYEEAARGGPCQEEVETRAMDAFNPAGNPRVEPCDQPLQLQLSPPASIFPGAASWRQR